MIFRGEYWCRETWLAWIDVLIGLQWEQSGEVEWYEYRAEWVRALFDGGKESGFIELSRR
jgi:hypothetical protein